MLEELEEKKSEIVKKAGEYRRRRNELNAAAIKWSKLRDELNKQIKEAIGKAKEFKRLREEYNKNAAKNKANRDELNQKSNIHYGMVKKMCELNGGTSTDAIKTFEWLRRKIEDLEFKQQIKVLNVDEERQLVAKIAELRRKFNEMQEGLEKEKRLKELLSKAQDYRKEADKYHEKLIKYEKLAQKCHDKMVESFKDADRLREKADEAHILFLKVQEEANGAHGLFIRYIRDIRDFDCIINGLKKKIYENQEFKERIDAVKLAKEIYERFKEGEKLNTEDLLLLQKARML